MHGRPRRRLLSRDASGAAVVEAVLVGVLLTGWFLAVVQIGLLLHARNVVAAGAAAGAREAAAADRDCSDGADRAAALVAAALSDRVATKLSYGAPEGGCEVVVGDVTLVRLRVRGAIPLLLPRAAVTVDVTAHAVKEGR